MRNEAKNKLNERIQAFSLVKQMHGNFQLIVQEQEWLANVNSPFMNIIYKGTSYFRDP